jgi:hypothetical protein
MDAPHAAVAHIYLLAITAELFFSGPSYVCLGQANIKFCFSWTIFIVHLTSFCSECESDSLSCPLHPQ